MDQTTAVQAPAAQSQPTLRTLLGLGGGRQAQGDVFAAIFQQLMMGGGEGGLGELLGQMQAPQGSKTEEDGQRLAMQMMAEFLFAAPGTLPDSLVQQLPPEQGQAAVAAVLDADGPPQDRQAAPEAVLSAVQPETDAKAQPGLQAKAGGASDGFYQVLESAWKEPEDGAGERMQSQSALREARQTLSEKPKERVEQPDVEKLQADVDAKRFLPAAAKNQAALLPDTREIARQLKTGILENTARGKNEFVVKLKPEGLGEITVKLAEDKSRITLSIITSSPQVARMITNEVAALQNALRPLHAEVQQVVTTQESNAAAYDAQQDALNGQHQQGFAGQQQFAGQHPNRFPPDGEEGEFGGLAQEDPADDGLDTYI